MSQTNIESVPAKVFKVLSIDAWRDGEGWMWNNWYNVETSEPFPEALLGNTRKTLNLLRKEGLMGSNSIGRVTIEDDQYNYVVMDRKTRQPLYAIEYGSQY